MGCPPNRGVHKVGFDCNINFKNIFSEEEELSSSDCIDLVASSPTVSTDILISQSPVFSSQVRSFHLYQCI